MIRAAADDEERRKESFLLFRMKNMNEQDEIL